MPIFDRPASGAASAYTSSVPASTDLSAVDKATLATKNANDERDNLQKQLNTEGKDVHDPLHAAMIASEQKVAKRVDEVQALIARKGARITIRFKAGREKGLFKKPRLSVNGKSPDATVAKAVGSLRSLFGEYVGKWESHKDSNTRLTKLANALKAQEKRADKTAKLLDRATQRLARAEETQARLAVVRARNATKLEKAQIKSQRDAIRTAKIKSGIELKKAQKEKRDTDLALAAARKVEQKDKEEINKRSSDRELDKIMGVKETPQRDLEKIKVAQAHKSDSGSVERLMGGISTLRRPPEVHVRQHRRHVRRR